MLKFKQHTVVNVQYSYSSRSEELYIQAANS
jgi:hypothetical protein